MAVQGFPLSANYVTRQTFLKGSIVLAPCIRHSYSLAFLIYDYITFESVQATVS